MQKQLRKSILENYLFMNKSFILRIQDYFSSMKIKEIIGDRQLQKFVIDLLKNLKTASFSSLNPTDKKWKFKMLSNFPSHYIIDFLVKRCGWWILESIQIVKKGNIFIRWISQKDLERRLLHLQKQNSSLSEQMII